MSMGLGNIGQLAIGQVVGATLPPGPPPSGLDQFTVSGRSVEDLFVTDSVTWPWHTQRKTNDEGT